MEVVGHLDIIAGCQQCASAREKAAISDRRKGGVMYDWVYACFAQKITCSLTADLEDYVSAFQESNVKKKTQYIILVEYIASPICEKSMDAWHMCVSDPKTPFPVYCCVLSRRSQR